jgi:hypothetical protein
MLAELSGTMSRARLQEAQKVAGAVIDDADYLTRLKLRAQSGSLPPAIEALLWHYRFGKPVEKISVSEEENLANLTDEELHQLAADCERVLRENVKPPDGRTNVEATVDAPSSVH